MTIYPLMIGNNVFIVEHEKFLMKTICVLSALMN